MATVRFTRQYDRNEPGDVEQVGNVQANWLVAHGYAVRVPKQPAVRRAVVTPEVDYEVRDADDSDG